MISYFLSYDSQLQAHTLKYKFSEEQPAISYHVWVKIEISTPLHHLENHVKPGESCLLLNGE